MKSRRFRRALAPIGTLLIVITVATVETTASADTAVIADANAGTSFILGPGRTAGWQFTVNAPLEVTHLGLYDAGVDGFQQSYPIAIWDSRGFMLTAATMPSGIGAPFMDGLRYIDIEMPGPVLLPGETYTIAYFAATIATGDTMIHFSGSHTLHPMLNQVGGAVVTSAASGQLAFPDSPFQGFDQWIGPGFQFNVVPAPGTILLLGMALMRCHRRRRDPAG